MKNISKTLVSGCMTMLISAFAAINAGAQDALNDTLPESDYNFQVPKHIVNIYSNFVPYMLFSILMVAMCYITYRYWADNRPHHDDFTHHGLGH